MDNLVQEIARELMASPLGSQYYIEEPVGEANTIVMREFLEDGFKVNEFKHIRLTITEERL